MARHFHLARPSGGRNSQPRRIGIGFVTAAFIVAALCEFGAGTIAAAAQTFRWSGGEFVAETIASGLDHPWNLAFLPDGRMLVTERPGRIRIVTRTGALSPSFTGVPTVYRRGQAGLFDLVIDRDYRANHTVYFCYVEPVEGGGRTIVASARVIDEGLPRLDRVRAIFRQRGPVAAENNYGCRIVQTPDRNIFASVGDHFEHRQEAQNLRNHIGKIVRIRPDGTVPSGNPFVGNTDAMPEIWSSGHRNPQGLALHPVSKKLWAHEHGPRGGDEVNIITRGKNYGWPVIGYGSEYSGERAHDNAAKEGMEQPIKYWMNSIAPSGMAFYSGNLFPKWRGNLFIGALVGRALVRLELDGERVVNEERLLSDLNERIRDVRLGPTGALWVLTDNTAGRILRLAPAR